MDEAIGAMACSALAYVWVSESSPLSFCNHGFHGFLCNRLERSSICSRMGWQRTSMPFLHFPRLLPGCHSICCLVLPLLFPNDLLLCMCEQTWGVVNDQLWTLWRSTLEKSTGLWALVNLKYPWSRRLYLRLCGQEQYRDYDAAARFWTGTQPMQLNNVEFCLTLSLSTYSSCAEAKASEYAASPDGAAISLFILDTCMTCMSVFTEV